MTTWLAPAKLNLFLHIVGRFEDGYHEVQTLYQLIDWYDELQFEITNDGTISRQVDIDGVPAENDLTIRAAQLLRRAYPGRQGVKINCKKNIPIGAGLGGGSSDAATTLLALNELWGIDDQRTALVEIGLELGADVPLFIHGENAWGEHKGDAITILSLPSNKYLVVFPNIFASTIRVYQHNRIVNFRPKISLDDYASSILHNDLEEAACQLYPEIQAVFEWLGQFSTPRMSGSGSAVFVELDSELEGQKILSKLPTKWLGRICNGLEFKFSG